MADYPQDTKLTAHLPNLDIEIRHRDEGAEGEVMSIQMRAVPNLEAVLHGLAPLASLGFVTPMPMPMFMPMAMAANPLALWLQMVEATWRPWLEALPDPTAGRGGRSQG